jgi:hypothetical protein
LVRPFDQDLTQAGMGPSNGQAVDEPGIVAVTPEHGISPLECDRRHSLTTISSNEQVLSLDRGKNDALESDLATEQYPSPSTRLSIPPECLWLPEGRWW